jgi:hypothetical protein
MFGTVISWPGLTFLAPVIGAFSTWQQDIAMAHRTPATWRRRLASSLLIGALVVAVSMVVVLMAGWPVITTVVVVSLLLIQVLVITWVLRRG